MSLYYFKAQGMSCAGCEGTLQSLASSVEGVDSAKANHQWQLLSVELQETLSEVEVARVIKTLIKEMEDSFPLELVDSQEAIFSKKNTNQNKTYPFIQKALLNLLFGVGFYFSASLFPVAALTQSWLMGSVVNLSVLGLMMLTGKEFYQDAWAKFKMKRTSMNTLIALSTLTAWSVSMLAVLMPSIGLSAFGFMPIFMILGITNAGRAVRAHQEGKAHDMMQSLDALFKQNQPTMARLVKTTDQSLSVIPFQVVRPGMTIEVREGERFPVDGELLSEAYINQKILTGETLVTIKQQGEMAYAGTVNTKGTIRIQACVEGKENTLLKLLQQVRSTQVNGKKPSSRMDTIIQWFVPSVIGIASLSAISWVIFTGSMVLGFNALTSVLLCACPCALGLAAPLSEAFGIYKLLHKNILVKDADKLNTLTKVDTLVFDKTGTLSEPSVIQAQFSDELEFSGANILASLEKDYIDEHPIANACYAFYIKSEPLKAVESSQKHESGQGVSGVIEGSEYLVGNLALMTLYQCKDSFSFAQKGKLLEDKGLTPIYLAKDKELHGVIGVRHELKTGVKPTLRALKEKGFNLILLTGDNETATAHLIEGLCFDKVLSEHSSDQKQTVLEGLKQEGHCVAYIGDGINDLKAAQASDIGISIGPWTHLASVAQVSLKGDIRDLIKCFELSELIQSNIRQNLNWTFIYNTISLLVASGALFPIIGMTFNPIIFAATMALSSIVVVVNASRLPSILDRAWVTNAPQPPSEDPLETDKLVTSSRSLINTRLAGCSINQTTLTASNDEVDSSLRSKLK